MLVPLLGQSQANAASSNSAYDCIRSLTVHSIERVGHPPWPIEIWVKMGETNHAPRAIDGWRHVDDAIQAALRDAVGRP